MKGDKKMYKTIADFGTFDVIDERIQVVNVVKEPVITWDEDYDWMENEVLDLTFWDMLWNVTQVTGIILMIISFIVSMCIFYM